MMEEDLFINIEYSPVNHAASQFSVRKNVTHTHTHTHAIDRKSMTLGWTDISSPGPISFLSRSSMYCITLALQNLINLLNAVTTNSFS